MNEAGIARMTRRTVMDLEFKPKILGFVCNW